MPRPLSAVVLNTTSHSGHHGCTLVCRQIGTLASAAGIEVRQWLPLKRGLPAVDWSADLVLVNGEGTFHHDRPGAREIARVGLESARRGVPAYLVNTLYEANPPALAEGARAYRMVFAREGLSAGELAAAGVPARVVPDLSLSWEPPPRHGRQGRGVVVIDSVLKSASAALFEFSRSIGADYRTMSATPGWMPDFPDRNLRTILRDRYRRVAALVRASPARRAEFSTRIEGFEDFVAHLREAALVVTGRFHGMCLAMDLGIPFLVLQSNSHKVEGLLADAGLPDRLARSIDEVRQRLSTGLDDLAFSEAESRRLLEFRARALAAASGMFRDIAADAAAFRAERPVRS